MRDEEVNGERHNKKIEMTDSNQSGSKFLTTYYGKEPFWENLTREMHKSETTGLDEIPQNRSFQRQG